MNDMFSNLRGELSRLWKGLSGTQQITVAGIGLITFASVLFFATWAQNPSYRVAFSKLNDADAGAVIGKLGDMKVPYQVADNGSAILVPSNKVHEVRFQLASQGLPQSSGIGFELFDKTNFGITDFTERLNYRRGLEGELSRTINSLSAVEASRVHIVIPQPELYSSREKQATASVVLKLRPGARLDSRHIRGIANLVASSAEGLKPQNVAILDTNGNVLSSQGDDALLGSSLSSSSTQLELQRSYEKELEQSVRAMLDTALGPNKAVVKVTAVMDWDREETQSESYEPEGAAKSPVRSLREMQETYSGQGLATASGSPGTESNLREKVAASADNSSGNKYDRKDITTNYELSKAVRRTVKAPGNLRRISLAVIMDGAPDDANLSSLKQALSAAVGLDPKRGDSLELMSMPFDRTFAQEQKEALQEAEKWNNYLDIGKGAALVVPLALFLLLLLLRSRHGSKRSRERSVYDISLSAEEEESLSPELRQKRLIQGKVAELAKGKPEIVAKLMRSWVEEG